ncbi:tRNA (adenosine(37)-N6)-dimethylallyltransferase MiaA [Rickettsiales bacterium LUAb2]
MSTSIQNKVIFIGGPTASGKSSLAINLAKQINGVIINADSSQIYKEAPILTAQPTLLEQQKIEHRLFGIINLGNSFNVTMWQKLVLNEINLAFMDNLVPILVGGSGFYISSLINGLSPIPEISNTIKLQAQSTLDDLGKDNFFNLVKDIDFKFCEQFSDTYRLLKAYEVFLETGKTLSYFQNLPPVSAFNYPFYMFNILPPRDELYSAINLRFDQMIDNGAITEARYIKTLGLSNIYYKKILGLQELINHLENELSLEEAVNLAKQKTRNYAKRQITWFKNQFKEANVINNPKESHVIPSILQSINIK